MAIRPVSGSTSVPFDNAQDASVQSRDAAPVQPNGSNTIASDRLLPDFRVGLMQFEINRKLPPVVETPPPDEINGLRAGQPVPIKIEPNDTQESVLRKAYAEYASRAGLSSSAQEQFVEQMMKSGGAQILHPDTRQPFTVEEFAAQKTRGSINMLPSDGQIGELRRLKIKDLLAYGIFDWKVGAGEEQQIVDLLKNDPNLPATIKDLQQSGWLEPLMNRIDETATRRELIQTLGAKADDEASRLIEPHLQKLDIMGKIAGESDLWQVQYNLARMGVKPSPTGFDRAAYGDLISGNPSAPFSGVGASGTNPTETSVPLGDKWGLFWENEATTAKYSNPVPGSLSEYLNGVGTDNRRRQAELLLNQPVSSTMPGIFGERPPTRAEVIKAAAAKYNLDPRMVGAIILAEQRDQSQLEDAKDYTAATSIMNANTSIGLGQVVISTAQNNDLFSDLIDPQTRKLLSHDDYAKLLADDAVNIFATAKYIRSVADRAAAAPPEVQARFPGVDFSKYRENSAAWSQANIQALGSEYTSAPWDVPKPGKKPPYVDSAGWGYFVGEAYKDVNASGVFK